MVFSTIHDMVSSIFILRKVFIS